ncbi:MAG: 23S rRNA (pseudouridine(1915)-N(3))-methyltransferase RlmH, partial [Caldisericaceae bacterium]
SIEKLLREKTFNVILDRCGKEMDSIAFANFVKEKLVYSSKDLAFFIGGADGFGEETLKRADYLLSFSNMTFPHEIARLLILEQIYRAFTIIGNEKYHR